MGVYKRHPLLLGILESMTMKYKLLILFSFLIFSLNGFAKDLTALYLTLDQTLPNQIKVSFQKGASENQLTILRETYASGKKLPQDLESLFKWKNGQKQGSPLSKNHNRRMLSIEESIAEKAYFDNNLLDIMLPWKDSWVPLLSNESGDFVVYELEGKNKGKLISYYHDWESRSIEKDSIELFLISMIDEYKK